MLEHNHDDGSVLDLIVVWTPTAETEIGGAGEMSSWIDGITLRTNMAFRNSGINSVVDASSREMARTVCKSAICFE